ncbi:MAG: energy transducer TonB [Bacteroidetes bacterium]|nr:energy transducer TonB [Bacteroidota bacterium]
MAEFHKKKQFLNMPKYPGGGEAFKAFVAENLHYPVEAMEANIEGSVMVEYDVHDTGEVSNSHIIKGLGYGCDEEAIRVINLLKFEKVKNRGLRVKMTTKTTIHFRLPGGVRINYAVTNTNETEKIKDPEKNKPGQVKYEYTISFSGDQSEIV